MLTTLAVVASHTAGHHDPGCKTRACDRRIDHQIAVRRRRAERAREASEGWAIPEYVVMCESKGQNLPPNSAGASGFYQIIVETWAAYGGRRFASEAWLASRAQQGVVARRIWTEAGASQWVCA